MKISRSLLTAASKKRSSLLSLGDNYFNTVVFLSNFDNVDVEGPDFMEAIGNTVYSEGVTYSTSSPKFQGGCAVFDGTSSIYANPHDYWFDGRYTPGNSNWSVGYGDFTIEGWINPVGNPGNNTTVLAIEQFGTTNTRPHLGIFIGPTGELYYLAPNEGGTEFAVSGATVEGMVPSNVWTHFALVRNREAWAIYINGVLQPESQRTFYGKPYYNSNQQLCIGYGMLSYNDDNFIGKMNGIRITRDVSRYNLEIEAISQAEFPTWWEPRVDEFYNYVTLLSHFTGQDNSTSIADETGRNAITSVGAVLDSANSRFGVSSVFFSGTNQYLTVPNSSDFDFGSGDFTIELWVSLNVNPSVSQYPGLITKRAAYTNQSFSLLLTGTADSHIMLGFTYTTDGVTPIQRWTASLGIAANTWNHYAVVRHGSSLLMFSNGVIVYSGTISGSIYTSTHGLKIGRLENAGDAGNDLNGWVDEIRITKGVARYLASSDAIYAAYPDQ